MDPAFATARHVDELTDVPLEGLPATDVDRIESALLGELRDLASRIDPPPVWGEADPC